MFDKTTLDLYVKAFKHCVTYLLSNADEKLYGNGTQG
jgi:hypothetical protein